MACRKRLPEGEGIRAGRGSCNGTFKKKLAGKIRSRSRSSLLEQALSTEIV
jgi:hypothetical protein